MRPFDETDFALLCDYENSSNCSEYPDSSSFTLSFLLFFLLLDPESLPDYKDYSTNLLSVWNMFRWVFNKIIWIIIIGKFCIWISFQWTIFIWFFIFWTFKTFIFWAFEALVFTRGRRLHGLFDGNTFFYTVIVAILSHLLELLAGVTATFLKVVFLGSFVFECDILFACG